MVDWKQRATILRTALIAAQDELSAIIDGQPDLVDDEVMEQIQIALEASVPPTE